MLKIGDFSRVGRVSVKALRHYDHLDLLRPARVDPHSGYRYYGADQLPRLNRILALKELGFTLEQMAPLLRENVSAEQVRGMLRLKRAEIERRRDDDNERLRRVEARLRLIESEDSLMGYDVIVKPVAAQTLASAREVVPTVAEMPARCAALCQDVGRFIGRQGGREAGPWFSFYYNAGYTESDIDVEMAVPVEAGKAEGTEDAAPPADATPRLRGLPGGTVAATVHRGSFDGITGAYAALGQWIEANGYRIAGPCREIYLVPPHEGEPVTEIQFPVETGA